MMKILVCTFSFPYFKNNIFDARFVYSEIVAYAKYGSEVIVLTPHFKNAPKVENMREHITIIRFPYFYPKSLQSLKRPGIPLYDFRSIFALLQVPLMCFIFMLNIFKYARHVDIIHAQWTPTALLALPAKWMLRKKLVLTARGSDIRLLPVWLNRYIFRNVDAAIDCFGPIQWNIHNKTLFPANYIKLPLLVHDDSTGNIPEEIYEITCKHPDTFIILYVGRFHPIKISENKLPLFNLIRASKTLKERGFNFYVAYVGEGSSEIIDKMNGLIEENGLTHHVSLIGAKTNIMDYIHYCNLGVGGIAFNGVSQEFTICQKPQILMDMVENSSTPWNHDTNCLFIKPEDTQDLINKITWAYENPDLNRAIGVKAADDMKDYFVESCQGGKKYLDAFEKLLSQNS